MNLDDFTKLKKKVTQLQQDKDRAIGASEQLMSRLKKEFECEDLDKAKKKLSKLTSKIEEEETRAVEMMTALRRDHPILFE